MIDAKELAAVEQRAHDLRVFADGLEDGGQVIAARRVRVAADDVRRVAAELRAERDARTSIQEQHAEAVRLLGNRAGAELKAAAW